MFGLGKKNSRALYGALFDIGSESVGIAIVETDHSLDAPHIIFSHRLPMRVNKDVGTDAERLRSMRETLFSASLIISRDGQKALVEHNPDARVSQLLVTVSAPWSHTISREVHYTGEKDLKITRALIHDLVEGAESEIATYIEETYGDTSHVYEIVERATVDVRINDYKAAHPIGLHGKEVSLVHITGVIPEEVLRAVEEVEEKIFPNTTVRPHTFLLVLFCIVREICKDSTALTLIHVTGETTEFGIVENDTLTESISIPHGLNDIVRPLMVKNQAASEIHSELTLYQEGKLAPDRQEAIDIHVKKYAASIGEKLDELTATHRFPKQIFLTAPHLFSGLFKEALTPTLEKSLGASSEILTIDEEKLGVSTQSGTIDLHIAVSARFFHKLHGCGEIGLG